VIGETLGQYKLTKELGKGGFATVYRALQPTLNRDVAIKVLHPEFIRDERALRRFKREALAVARLHHTNIVGVYDYGEHEGRAYLVMEYIAGSTLKSRLGKPASLELTVSVIGAVGAALDYAHSKGVVHRDIKPANILFADDDRVVLSDFGIVRLADDDSSLTRGVIGTPQYMSPEQALGREVDGRSDLYSLGVVLFEMLTGAVPFRGDSPIATLSMHATMPVPSVRQRNPNLSESVDALVRKALGKNPDERYQTGAELSVALSVALGQGQQPTMDSTMRMPTMQTATSTSNSMSDVVDLDTMYNQLLILTRERNWRGAVNLAAQILARDSNYRDVSAILNSASNELRFGRTTGSIELQLQDLLGQAEVAIADAHLMEAAGMLQQILRASPNDNYARARLEMVNQMLADQETTRRRHSRLEQLYSLAQSKVKASDWRWAHNILEEIANVDPQYRDVQELLELAQESLQTEAGNELSAQDIHTMRDQAETAMAQERWADAVTLWEQIQAREPNLAGIAERYEIALQRSQLAALSEEAARLAADGLFEEAIQKLEELKVLTES